MLELNQKLKGYYLAALAAQSVGSLLSFLKQELHHFGVLS